MAAAQWSLKDYDGAKQSYEAIRGNDPHDIDANLALANIYEREFQRGLQHGLQHDKLALSDQAIGRVLGRAGVTPKQRAEAEALQGRNCKTLWRSAFAALGTVEARRAAALDRARWSCRSGPITRRSCAT